MPTRRQIVASKKEKTFLGDSYIRHTDRAGRTSATSRDYRNPFTGTVQTTTTRTGGRTSTSTHYGRNTRSKK